MANTNLAWQGDVSQWKRLDRVAEVEQLVPLLYDRVQRADHLHDVPEQLRDRWKEAFVGANARSAVVYDEFPRILRTLAAPSPIPVMLLKGVVLGPMLYRNPALRTMADIDLLVPAARLSEAERRIKEVGYVEQSHRLTDHHAIYQHNAPLAGGPRRIVVLELHDGLVAGQSDWRSPPIEWFWRDTEPWQGADPGHVFQPSPTAHLLYLTAHLVLQHWHEPRIRWLYDIHLLVQSEFQRIDWPELARRAEQYSWTFALREALTTAQRQFGTQLPAGFLQGLSDVGDRESQRFVASATHGDLARGWEKFRAKTTRGRLRMLAALVFPRASYLRSRYRLWHPWLWPLAIPWRWVESLGIAWRLLAARKSRPVRKSDETPRQLQ